MASYVIRRLMFGVILVFVATVVSFTILRASPGKAGAAELDPRLSKEYIEEQERLFGLDQPPVRQYLRWLGVLKLVGTDDQPGILQGNMGKSITYKQPVANVIGQKLAPALLGLLL